MKKSLVVLLLLFAVTAVYAQDISISANVDKQEITLDDQIILNIVVSGSVSKIPQPTIPSLDGFTAYSSGRSQNISIINGQVTGSVSFNYMLVPNDVGEYTLGPFSIDYKGNTYSADAIDIKVLPRSTQSQAPSYAAPDYTEGQGTRDKGQGKELFIETYVDKLRAYVNEQITLTFAFYQAVNLFENPVYNPASTTGFWTEDMPPQKKYYKVINGTKYLVTEIKTALFATSPGEFTIGSARLEASVEDLERFSSRSPFDIFGRDPFSVFRRGKPVILATDPINVEISALPEEGKPLNFKGDVGTFDISGTIDKDTVEENQPVTLRIVIKGKGNIKTISSPGIPESSDVKFYDSASSENISKENYLVQGEKIFEKMIIPKSEGRLTIGPIEYSYFDPVLKRYIERRIEPMTINATVSEEEPQATMPFSIPGLSKEEIKLLKKDICYIKTSPINFRKSDSFFYKNKAFYLINILPLAFLIFLYMYELHRERLKTDIGYARSRRARGAASKRLKKARQLMLKEKVKEFYAEIYKAVIEYVADKLNIPHPSITKDLLEEKLKSKGLSESAIAEIKELFDICDMARFALVKFTKEDMHKTIEQAIDIIAELERVR
ncbi:MAG: BatD family protein [Candidatus Gorgyraea atricola]|nr:BatD family protein [Candidatus Gorgyraea atricola]